MIESSRIAQSYDAASRALDRTSETSTSRGTGGIDGAAGGPPSVDFSDALKGAIANADQADRGANDLAERFARGDSSVGIHEVVIASEKANISVRYAVTLKNKAIEAYRELLNTPV